MKLYSVALVLLMSTPIWAEFEKLQLQDGRIYVGQVYQLDDQQVILETPQGFLRIPLKQLTPLTIYTLTARRMSIADPYARLTLAYYCYQHQMFVKARQELALVIAADPSQATKLAALKRKIVQAGARKWYLAGMRSMQKRAWEQAYQEFMMVVRHFPDTLFTKLARENLQRLPGLQRAGQD